MAIEKVGKFKIEKGIPVPPKHKTGEFSDLLRNMSVGDSVLIEGTLTKNLSTNLSNYRNNQAPETLWTTRRESSGKRIWRLK